MAPTAFCPRYHHAVELLGRRWNGAILRAMLAGRSRYAEIRAAVPGLSDTLLSKRLDELEAEGLLERHVLATTPVGVEYRLTDKGRDLEAAVRAISTWAEEWLPLPPGADWSPEAPEAPGPSGGAQPRALGSTSRP